MPQNARISQFQALKLTKPHQGFILIILSNLALALVQILAFVQLGN